MLCYQFAARSFLALDENDVLLQRSKVANFQPYFDGKYSVGLRTPDKPDTVELCHDA
jgi:hypothetical protein